MKPREVPEELEGWIGKIKALERAVE